MPPKHKRSPAEATEKKAEHVKTPDSELKLLPTKSSYYRVIEVIKGLASERFGDLARLLDTGKYFAYPLPVKPSAEELKQDVGGLLAEEWKVKLKLAMEVNTEMAKNKTKFYSFLLNKCSEALVTKLESEETFQDLQDLKDPLQLFQMIKKICIEGDESSRAVDSESCEEAYWSIRQRSKESCLEYHKRFKNIVKSLIEFDKRRQTCSKLFTSSSG
jgi:hypothetical protein